VERGNPNGVSDGLSKRTARDAECSSGRKMLQKAKAASRKATGNHNWADRAGKPEIPTLKGG
jgi:hypothetical protein